MGQMIEGRWDCTSCGKKMIQGRYKHCPGCGKGRGEDVKFYIADPNDVVAADVPEQGPDWMCPYCQAYAPDSAKYCPNCGAPRDENAKSYHDIQKEQQEKAAEAPAKSAEPARKRSPIFFFVILAAIAAMVLYFAIPRHADARITSKAWQREIDIESYNWVDDEGWSLPSGAHLKTSQREIRTYSQVLDHYETRSREVPEEYISGYTTEYEDLGNGYFRSYDVPVYDTRYRTEYYQEPVYISVPVYDTKYYYEIQRWVFNRTLTSGGEVDEPYWPDLSALTETERESARRAQYAVKCEGDKGAFTCKLPLEQWQSFNLGDWVNLTLSAGGTVREITHAK